MRRIERGGRRGRLASEGRHLVRGLGGSSHSKRRRAWEVCGRGGRSGGFRGGGLSRGAVREKRGLVYDLFNCVVCCVLSCD